MEIWDGYFKDGTHANIDLIRGDVIPDGLYYIACEVLVQHIDGDYLIMRRDFSKPYFGGCYEATAGGSALKGEDKIACIKRELYEETGIISDNFEELDCSVYEEDKCILFTFLCITDCEKTSIKLQKGETISYEWLNEREFISFINSDKIVELQKNEYLNYFKQKGYL